MNNVMDVTEDFGTLYHPKSALVFYESKGLDKEVYVEHFDMDNELLILKRLKSHVNLIKWIFYA